MVQCGGICGESRRRQAKPQSKTPRCYSGLTAQEAVTSRHRDRGKGCARFVEGAATCLACPFRGYGYAQSCMPLSRFYAPQMSHLERPCAFDMTRCGVFRASQRSVRRCVFSQKSGELPKTRPRIRAVSAVTARRFRHNSLTCLRGKPVFSASSVWVMPIGSITSSINISPTLTGFLFISPLHWVTVTCTNGRLNRHPWLCPRSTSRRALRMMVSHGIPCGSPFLSWFSAYSSPAFGRELKVVRRAGREQA
jgi:hypothetical protein